MIRQVLLVMSFATAVVNASTLDVGLIAKLNFDDNINDQSGNNAVTSSMNIQYVQDRFNGNSGKAAQFNGNAFVNLPTVLIGKNINQKFTFSIWTKPETFLPAANPWKALAESTQGEYGDWGNNGASPYFVLHADNSVRFASYLGVEHSTPVGEVLSNDWNHIVFRGDESTRTISIDIFNQNGHLFSEENFSSSEPLWGSQLMQGMLIGADRFILFEPTQSQPTDNFIGQMDDIRIYNRTLSNSEVIALNATESVPEPSALSLLAIGLGGLALIRRRRS